MNNSIKGNIKTREELQKNAQNNNILHSYLFLGQDGIGKKQIAFEFAEKILCLTKQEKCNCKSCMCLKSHNHPDFTIINEEGDIIKISAVREMIQTIYEKPILSDRKIYIINDVDKMTVEAQNSLLKTLEEPPEYAVLILISSNPDMILSTIKSRCSKLIFKKLNKEEITEILKEKNINKQISDEMYDFFEGSADKAIKITQNEEQYKPLLEFVEKIKQEDKLDFLIKNKEIFSKDNINEILEYLIVLLYHKGQKSNEENYLECINIVQETMNCLKANSNFDMSIDNMLFKIWEEVNEDNSRY